jgi:hypothetical protein
MMTGKIFGFAVALCLSVSGCDSANPVVEHKKDSGDIEEFRIGMIAPKEYLDSFRPFDLYIVAKVKRRACTKGSFAFN